MAGAGSERTGDRVVGHIRLAGHDVDHGVIPTTMENWVYSGGRDQGRIPAGRMGGRPVGITADVIADIESLRASGSSLRTIAEFLSHRKAPTSQGGKQWYASTVQQTLTRAGRDA